MAKEKMVIEFTPDQTEKYLAYARKHTSAELGEDCMPSGLTIVIDLCPPFGNIARVNDLDLGDIEVTFKAV